jgi:hypothetical protein
MYTRNPFGVGAPFRKLLTSPDFSLDLDVHSVENTFDSIKCLYLLLFLCQRFEFLDYYISAKSLGAAMQYQYISLVCLGKLGAIQDKSSLESGLLIG